MLLKSKDFRDSYEQPLSIPIIRWDTVQRLHWILTFMSDFDFDGSDNIHLFIVVVLIYNDYTVFLAEFYASVTIESLSFSSTANGKPQSRHLRCKCQNLQLCSDLP